MQKPCSRKQTPLLIPILRAGLGMVDAFLSLVPTAKVGHIGLMRNEETHQPNAITLKFPMIAHNILLLFVIRCSPQGEPQ